MKISKKFKIPFALFLILYFVYLVAANAPAGWAAWGVTKAAPGLWLSSPHGSVWQGKASTAQITIPGQPPLALGELEWRLSPMSLLILRPCLDITTSLPGQNISGNVCQSLGGASVIKNLTIDTPIETINQYLKAELSGDVSLQVTSAQIDSAGKIKQLDARYSWQRGRAQFEGTWLDLGSFAGTLKENGRGGVLTEIFDLEGPFKAALNGEWPGQGQDIQLAGTITPQKNASELIVQGLQILGEDLGDGSFKVQWP